MGTSSNSSRTKVSVGRDVDASLTFHRKLQAVALRIDLRLEEVEPLPSCIEVIRPLGAIEICLLGGKKAIKDVRLILRGDTDSEILYPEEAL